MRTFGRHELASADLFVDAKYEGGRGGNAGDDPLPYLLGVSNQGGFRYLGSVASPRLIVVTSTLTDPDWPDSLVPETGIFTYFGDNKKPGRDLHGTPRFGNTLLRNAFNATHTGERRSVPPVLVFTSSGEWRDMIFRGLAVPGVPGLSQLEDLVAVWKISGGQRFQNYQAKFTLLDAPRIERGWLEDLSTDSGVSARAPAAWIDWIRTGRYAPLRALRTLEIRSKAEQLPANAQDTKILKEITSFFARDPHGFEACAVEIVRMSLGSISSIDLTRPSRDGGRDAVGKFQIGEAASAIQVDFAVEAKCYSVNNSVGVREISRLISRLRHRHFGVIVTSSWLHTQAYREIKEDGHPIIVLSGGDIVRTLRAHDFATVARVREWLAANFSPRIGRLSEADHSEAGADA